MATKSRIEHGVIDIDVGDEVVTLKPTLNAYKKLEKRFGGMKNALEGAAGMSLESIAFIVAAGSGKGQREAAELEEKLWAVGLVHVLPKVTDYLVALINPTGKDPEEGAGESSGE